MLENIITFLLLLVLCRGNYGVISSFLSGAIGGMDAATLHTVSITLTILLFGLLFVVFRFFIGKAMPALHDLSLPEVWRSFRQGICLHSVLQLIIGVAVSVFVGLFLLMGAYCLPTAPIQQHLKEYIPYPGGSYEGIYPTLSPLFTSTLDGYTDSLILLQSGDDTEDTLLNKALLVYCGLIRTASDGELDPAQTFSAHYQSGVPFTKSSAYPRYWHGYLIFTKPLLSLLNFYQLRILNGLAQVLLTLWVCWLLKRHGLKAYIPAYLLIYLMLMPAALALSLQFSPCYYIAAFSTAALLLMGRSRAFHYSYLVFLFTGISVAYFDFLTYPLVTFGFPAVFFALLLRDKPAETVLGKLVQNGISWLWGYAGMWASKWVLATLLTDRNVIQDAFSQARLRSSNAAAVGAGSLISHSLIEAIGSNLLTFLFTPFTLILLVFVCYTIYKIRRSAPLSWSKIQGQLLIYGAVGCLPLLWYSFLANHSLIHYWFTNKASSVLVLCVLFSCAVILELIHQQESSVPKR